VDDVVAPAALDSARAGRASLGNVTLIAQLADAVGVAEVAPLERILVGAAETLDLGAMRIVTQETRLRIDPDGVLADDNRARPAPRTLPCPHCTKHLFATARTMCPEGRLSPLPAITRSPRV
jgi:hypothetical protein